MRKDKIDNKKEISGPTLRRLPLYHSFLITKKNINKEFITARDIAEELHIDPTQVTKDFSYINVKGKPKVGYETDFLITIIEEYLGYKVSIKAFVVGLGKLGSALINYHEFHDVGLDIISGFDAIPERINSKCKIKLFHIDKFKERFKKTPVDLGIIAVPADKAQKIADLMIDCGMKAIWNFSAVPLSVPENIIVENTSIDSSLAIIKWKLQNNRPLIYKNRML
jgi:redox-sensing transcriptional repressor